MQYYKINGNNCNNSNSNNSNNNKCKIYLASGFYYYNRIT